MRLAWLTDIHLNFLAPPSVERFLDSLRQADANAILLGGDIGEAQNVISHLARLAEAAPAPVHFVLGNHDFYHGSICAVRDAAEELCRRLPTLNYLTRAGVVELTPALGLVGHDGWADGRLGDYPGSTVMLNDYALIRELRGMTKDDRRRHLEALGDEAAGHVRRWLPEALATYPRVLFLTHVPPFREACWHQGRTSNDEWLPHFTCRAVGDALVEIAERHPDRQITVLCGHTHSSGQTSPRPNLVVHTGQAEYGQPRIQRVWDES
jgi:3',5'-cyclic AMP phosphodiesterase CpdA